MMLQYDADIEIKAIGNDDEGGSWKKVDTNELKEEGRRRSAFSLVNR